MWALGWVHFWPQGNNLILAKVQGNNLNNLGKSPLAEDIVSNSKDLLLSDKNIFNIFPIRAYEKQVTPAQGHFWPKGYNLNNLAEVH